jgi:DtxR family transcriptional regulator, Mn-dependent transcriptional regulator
MDNITDDNYLKAIYHLRFIENNKIVSPTMVANELLVKSPSVLEKLKRLGIKKYIKYEKNSGIELTKLGKDVAVNVVRRHRIWETYLNKHLGFNWGEVHELAEDLEHFRNEKLIDKIYEILGCPEFDPHGDPIPNKQGVFPKIERRTLSTSAVGCKLLVVGVIEHSDAFLKYLSDIHLNLNDKITIANIIEYDGSIQFKNKENVTIQLSKMIADKVMVRCQKSTCTCKNK